MTARARFGAIVDKALCAVGLPTWFRRENKGRLTIFMYHGVVQRALVPDCWHQLPLDVFRRQLEWIRAKYSVLPLERALDEMEASELPSRSAAITFDDGFFNNKSLAWPVLQELDLPATIFVVTDALGCKAPLWPDRVHLAVAAATRTRADLSVLGLGEVTVDLPDDKADVIGRALRVLKRTPTAERDAKIDSLVEALGAPETPDPGPFRLMGWDDVREMAADARISFGAHTRSHPILSQCEDADVDREIAGSQAALAEALGRRPTVFAYPNGRLGDFDDRARAAVDRADIDFALSTETGFADVTSDPMALPRVCVGSDLSFDRFRLVASGAWKALRG